MAAPPTSTVRPDDLLAEAGRMLAASLQLEETLRVATRLAIPELAEWCSVEIVEHGRARAITSGHADPRVDALLAEVARRHRAGSSERPPAGVLRVLATGEPAIHPAGPIEALPLVDDEERALWRALAPVSWLIVPMRAGGEVLGAISFLSTDPDRAYGEQDLPVALELAERCALAVRNAQAYEEAESARALLDAVFATAPVGLALLDADGRPVLVNDRMAAAGEMVGVLERIAGSTEAVVDEELVADGRAFLASWSPVAVDGRTLGVVVALTETTERRRAQDERERLLERTRRLQAVTEHLSAALTKDEVAEVIFQEGMAATGACCGVLGLRDGGALRIEHRFGMAGGAPGLLPLTFEAPMPVAARTRAPVLLPSRAAWLERFPDVPPRSDFEAFAAVPLLFEDGVAGVMGLGFPEVRAFDEGDVEMLLGIARQGAQALERARLYEERAYVARTLQEGLLPRSLPDIDGLDVAVRYRPLGDGVQVGGDFYDLVALDDGGWLVVVGDICGKGIGAAVLTGVMRSTIRALALFEQRPAALLEGVNAALLHERSPHALATMACAVLRRDGDGFSCAVAVGGHPPPLVRRAGGDVVALPATGPLLGMDVAVQCDPCDARLAPGDLLLLYTDGVIDARRAGATPFGEERLVDTVRTAPPGDAAALLDAVDDAVRAFAPGPPLDDKALLALRAVAG